MVSGDFDSVAIDLLYLRHQISFKVSYEASISYYRPNSSKTGPVIHTELGFTSIGFPIKLSHISKGQRMHKYGATCDEFYVNMHLSTEMDLPQNREAILHFFEQIQKRFPQMSNFYARERGEFVLEEEKESGKYRWVSTEQRRLCSGTVNPDSLESAIEQHQTVLQLIPFELSISHLDCESLSLTLGFDFNYRGNHNALIAEALGVAPGFEKFTEIPGSSLLSCEPMLQIALDDECKTQCRVAFETRTTAYQVRANEFAEEPLSVYLTLRRYDSLGPDEDFGTEVVRLAKIAEDLVDSFLVEQVLQPLQQTIALK